MKQTIVSYTITEGKKHRMKQQDCLNRTHLALRPPPGGRPSISSTDNKCMM